MSKLISATIKTSENNQTNVMATAQQINNDVNGNPRYFIQMWIVRPDGTGNIWCPARVGGRKATKDDGYRIQSYNIEEDLKRFIADFESAVKY